MVTPQVALTAGLADIRRHWMLHLTLGVLLVLLGVVALGYSLMTTVLSVLVFGWVLIGGGIFQAVLAFRVKGWGGFTLHVLGGILQIIVGFLVIGSPLDATLLITLIVAIYLMVGGLFRLITALWLHIPGSGWAAFGGFVSFLAGLALRSQWPSSGLWFIGTCVAIDLLLHGVAWIVFALEVKKLPEPFAAGARA